MTTDPKPKADPKLQALLDEAIELENDHLPQIRPTTISQPNAAKSEVVHVRVSEQDHRDLMKAAAALNVPVSDVIRTAIHRFLHKQGESREVEYLLHALHESGLCLKRI
jgi:predicted HicB family RNase H-like nuclease